MTEEMSIAQVETSNLKDLVVLMAKFLVDHPDEVEVTEVEGEQTTVLGLKVAKNDLGKIIGKKGRTAQSLRTILNAASTKLQKRTVLDIKDDRPPQQHQQHWD